MEVQDPKFKSGVAVIFECSIEKYNVLMKGRIVNRHYHDVHTDYARGEIPHWSYTIAAPGPKDHYVNESQIVSVRDPDTLTYKIK